MSTLAWVLILTAGILVHSVAKGRSIAQVPGDLADLLAAAASGDQAGITEAFNRSGDNQTPTPGPVNNAFNAPSEPGHGIPDPKGESSLTVLTVAARRELLAKWPGTTVGGFRGGTNAQDHALGMALDAMVGTDKAKGDAIAAWAQGNAERMGVSYVIWQQRIWNPTRAAEGWRGMADRGSLTQNHRDHVHISFKSILGMAGKP